MSDDARTAEVIELLQAMIRNACVNDGTPDSGHEVDTAGLLETVLAGAGEGVVGFAPAEHPGRRSVVARLEGSEPTAPSLCLMGHTDVVPATTTGWSREPFGGELVGGEVWGRGAIDMLNVTASMAIAFRDLAASGWKPKGTLIYFGVADEEAGGEWGARWMCEHDWEVIRCDYVVTEIGGYWFPSNDGVRRAVVNLAEKGVAWRTLGVRGTPSHGSMPFGTDNALVKAAEAVRRLASFRPDAGIDDAWRTEVSLMPLDDELKKSLVEPTRIWQGLQTLPPTLARWCHARTHTTFSPNVIHGGQKTNVIPDRVTIEVDIRTVPGTTGADVDAYLREALGDLAGDVEVSPLHTQGEATRSLRDTALWDALVKATQVAYPGAELVPGMVVGATDARFFRDKGAVAYGTGLFSPGMTWESFGTRFHGIDERIDVESLRLATTFWMDLAREVCG
jgi:acetylornithine deacetylase/succinyl-diaminopimelate desuccinylase-like protein